MAISSIKTLVNDGGGGTTSTTNITNTKTGSTSNTNPEAQFEVINPDSGVVSNNIEKYTPTYRLSSIEEFKEAADLINQNRKEAKLQIDELSKNLYSTLNQINFSIKLIIETNGFLTQYTNDEANLLSQLTELLTVENKETTMELSNNIRFNNLFISSIFFFENFSRILIEAISEYLLNNGSALLDPGFDVKVEDIFNNYCEKFFIKND
jgi:ABC-type Zn uptake system ZnuABC Zn-binding protein ZnuA